MPTIRFECPRCGATGQGARELDGQRVWCRACGGWFAIEPAPPAGERHPPPAAVAKFAGAVVVLAALALLAYALLALASLSEEVAELREAQARQERALTEASNAVKALRHRLDQRAGEGPVLRGTLLKAAGGKLVFRRDGEAQARTIALDEGATVRVGGRGVRPGDFRLDRPAPATVTTGDDGKAVLVEVSPGE